MQEEPEYQNDKYVLIELIEEEYGLNPGEFMANINSRQQKYMFGRRILFVIIRERHTKLTLEKIGKIVGQDHATVLNALKKHEKEHNRLPRYGKSFDNVYFKFNTSSRDHLLQGSKKILIEKLAREMRKRLQSETAISAIEERLKELDHIKPETRKPVTQKP